MNFKLQAIIVFGMALLVGFFAGSQHGITAGLAAGAVMAYGMTLFFQPPSRTLGVTIATALKRAKMLDAALEGFKRVISPLRAFATQFNDVPLEGTDDIVVAYYPIETAPSKDFDGTYEFDDASIESRTIPVNKRKYQSLSLTSKELARQPILRNPEILGMMKGQKLAYDVVADVMSLITAANFGSAAFTGAASTFDSDDVATLKGVADLAHWPEVMRSLVLSTDFDVNVMKDDAVKKSPSMAITEDALLRGQVPTLSNFAYFASAGIPANGEYLAGFISYMSAILFGLSPIKPAQEVLDSGVVYNTLTDAETGITIEERRWGSGDSDAVKHVIECNYGRAVGEAAALKRIVTQ